jgi:hypothetical protein
VGGIVDRLDQTEQGLRIVDYKTGRSLKQDFNDWDQLIGRDMKDRRKEILQTLIYADILSRTENTSVILPSIYKLDDLFAEEFNPGVIYQGKPLNFQDIAPWFRENFDRLLLDVFDPQQVYGQVKDAQKCSFCPYNKICRR